MRSLPHTVIGIVLASPMAIADGLSLAGSLWQCTRASDRSQFVITFYPGGGVGGGEMEGGEVSPYIFDPSRKKQGERPGRWDQTGQRFTWAFPDQSMRIEGSIQRPDQPAAWLAGIETSPGGRSAVACMALPKLLKIGEGLVVPRDSRFLDLDGGEGTLMVPAGISLQKQGSR